MRRNKAGFPNGSRYIGNNIFRILCPWGRLVLFLASACFRESITSDGLSRILSTMQKGGRPLGQPPFFWTRAPWGLRVNTAVQITVCRRRGQAVAPFSWGCENGHQLAFWCALRLSRLAVQALRHALEIVLVGLVLELLELVEAPPGDLVRRLLVAVAEALEHLATAERQEAVEQTLTVLHTRKDVPLGPVLERVEQHRDEAVQLPDLILG